MKIFEFNPAKGYADQVSGVVGVNTNGTIERTEKGLAWRGASGGGIDTGVVISEQEFSVVAAARVIGAPYAGNYHCLVSSLDANDDGWQLHIDHSNNGRVAFTVNTTDVSPISPKVDCSDGNWHLIIGVWDSSGGRAYVDCILEHEILASQTINISETFRIGRNRYAGTQYIRGFISNAKIYDHALTESERAKLYKEFLVSSQISKTVK